MGIFNKLFGKQNEKEVNPVDNILNKEYNVMKNISIGHDDKYENTHQYKLIENHIYIDQHDKDDTNYRMTICYELEANDNNNQYPLDDILDKYLLYVTDFYEARNDKTTNKFTLELGGSLENLKQAQEIVGKRVFNEDFKDEEGQIRVKLTIE